MNIIFFGSDDLAGVSLERLAASDYNVVACVTQPDRARGRGLKLAPSAVKVLALRHGIPVLQPDDIRDESFIQELERYESDLFVVIAYGKILPVRLLDIPRICAVNVHASLLPKYRGAAPINWAIIRGETETGVTIIQMNAVMDAGDIIAQQSTAILDDDTAVTLRVRLAELGADNLIATVAHILDRSYSCCPQDAQAVTLAPKLTKAMGLIDWNQAAQEIHLLIRGLQPWPSAYTHYQGKLLKILESAVVSGGDSKVGTVLDVVPEGFVIATGRGALFVKKVHLEAGKPMDAKSFVAGHQLAVGDAFLS